MVKYFLLSLVLLLPTLASANDSDFPGRERYPAVAVLSLDQLHNEKNDVVIIDARSPYEYQTLRIKNAVSVPLVLPTESFKKHMHDLRTQHPNKKLVFYCNGHTCMKSYKAVNRSIRYLKMKNVYAYDAGVFDWAQKHPNDTMLLSDLLSDPAKLISKADFKKHVLPAEKFMKQADESVTILDIRDRIERDGFYIFSGYEKSISLNLSEADKLKSFIQSVKKSNKPLYVYDMVGKQVKWFQYYLESNDIKKYYFMEGGANAFFDIPISNLMD